MHLNRLKLAIKYKQKRVSAASLEEDYHYFFTFIYFIQCETPTPLHFNFFCKVPANGPLPTTVALQFVAHPNVQQLLASIWYEGLPGFRQKNMILQV